MGKKTFLLKNFPIIATLFSFGELLLCVFIINFIKCKKQKLKKDTEIDWIAYMDEVKGYISGDWDYSKLQGPTGPLVYPAGFVYFFTTIRQLTSENVLLAQYLFAGLYFFMIIIIFMIYKKSFFDHKKDITNNEILLTFLFLCFSKRIHSIFVLRLFNDCLSMLILYISILSFIYNQDILGCLFFSYAISIKMNILLFLPGLLVILVQKYGIIKFLPKLSLMVILQIVLAIPFLYHDPMSYLARSFSTKRKFVYKWSVNYKFLTEEQFGNEQIGRYLLLLQLLFLIIFAFKWCKDFGVWNSLKGGNKLSSKHIVYVLFTSNFIGIVFMKSLHFQFYLWYFHTIPFLLFLVPLNNYLRFLYFFYFRFVFFVTLEIVWNVFPSNFYSSLILQFLHFVLLFLLSIFV
jgi:alpha-1,3-mannosyltransferase